MRKMFSARTGVSENGSGTTMKASPPPRSRNLRQSPACSCLLSAVLTASSFNSGLARAVDQPKNDAGVLRYCVPSATVNLYPYRVFESGYDMAYLTALTRSYISTDPLEPGLLSKWQFSPDGHDLRAEVSPTATWTDGTPLSPREAALGIVKGFQYRPIGDRVHVPGDKALKGAGWQTANVDGLKIIDAKTFEIHFDSDIKNLSGAIRDAISTNSRQNRVWPARLSLVNGGGNDYGDKIDLISKLPLASQEKKLGVAIKVGTEVVAITPKRECTKEGDFYLYSNEIYDHLAGFTVSLNNGEQTVYALINGGNKDLKTKDARRALASWILQAYAKADKKDAFQPSYAHFHDGEPGSGAGVVNWSDLLLPPSKLALTRINWAANNDLDPHHPVRRLLEEHAKKTGKTASFRRIQTKDQRSNAHFLVESSRVEQGRQIWMQDAASSPFYQQFLAAFPATTAALKTIAEKSAATIPVDNVTLRALDKAAAEEVSVIPLGRVRVPLYSRKTSPVEVVFTTADEITFVERKAKP